MTDPRERRSLPHDDELGELYRRLPADEPRAEIDLAILEAGRRAAARRTSVLRHLRWAAPLAAAAGVVLTLTLTRVTERSPEPVSLESTTQAAKPPLPSPQSGAHAPEAAPAPAAQDSLEKDASAARARRGSAGPEQEALRAQPAPPPPARAEAPDRRAQASSPKSAPQDSSPLQSPPPAASPSAPPPDAGSVAAMAAPEAAAPGANEPASAPCMDDGVESAPDPAPPEICPFQFRANVSAAATCEALSKQLRRPCRVDGDRIEMRLEPPVTVADGASVERILVDLEAGQALRMRMQLAGGGERVCPSAKPAR